MQFVKERHDDVLQLIGNDLGKLCNIRDFRVFSYM